MCLLRPTNESTVVTAVQCPVPDEITDGRVIYSSLAYGTEVRYECRYGFQLSGPSTRTCGLSKTWEGGPDPKCLEIDCGHPGNLVNGFLDGRRTTLGAVIHFRCYDGMTFVGSNTTTCQDTGQWSHPLPACMAPCMIPEVEHGRVNVMTPGNKVLHGDGINVDCKPQYELSYNSTQAVCHNGSWTHLPKCVPGQYASLSRPSSMKVNFIFFEEKIPLGDEKCSLDSYPRKVTSGCEDVFASQPSYFAVDFRSFHLFHRKE